MDIKKIIFFIIIFLFFLTLLLQPVSSVYLKYNKIIGLSFVILWIIVSRRLELPSFFIRYLLFILYALFTALIVNAIWEGVWGEAKTILQLSFILLLVYNISISLSFLDDLRFISTFLLVYLIIAYFGHLIGINANGVSEVKRMSGLTSNPNSLGIIVLYGLISILYLIESQKNRLFRFITNHWYLIFIVAFLLLLPTGSRKSLVVFTGILIFYTLIKQKSIFNGILGLTFILVPIIVTFWEALVLRFQSSIMGERFLNKDVLSSGFDTRKHLYEQAVDVFTHHPVLGVGLGNFRYFSDRGLVAHSYYMEMLTCTGIIGFLIILSIYYLMGRRTYYLFKSNTYKPESIFIFNFLFLTSLMSFGFSYHNSFIHWFIISFIFVFLDKVEQNPESYD